MASLAHALMPWRQGRSIVLAHTKDRTKLRVDPVHHLRASVRPDDVRNGPGSKKCSCQGLTEVGCRERFEWN